MSKLKVYKVDFKPIFPVGSCLIILAKDKRKATKIAKETIVHTSEFTVELHPSKEGVVIYMDGDY